MENNVSRCSPVAGMAGFEPASAGVKVLCLTAWRHPCVCAIPHRTTTGRWGITSRLFRAAKTQGRKTHDRRRHALPRLHFHCSLGIKPNYCARENFTHTPPLLRVCRKSGSRGYTPRRNNQSRQSQSCRQHSSRPCYRVKKFRQAHRKSHRSHL